MNDTSRVAAEARPVSKLTSNAGPLVAFALLALIWGYNWVVMKLALQYAGPLDFAALRVALGALLLFLLLVALRIPLKPRHVVKTFWLGMFARTLRRINRLNGASASARGRHHLHPDGYWRRDTRRS